MGDERIVIITENDRKDKYLCNGGLPMEEVDRANYRDKAKAPCVRKHRRVEAAYSSVSVMDDAAKDALSQVKLPMTNRHG